MKSNGFGTFLHYIVVLVPAADGDKAAMLLGHAAEELLPEGKARVFAWTHPASRLRDDERVVFDLGMILGKDIAWSIDWGRSSY